MSCRRTAALASCLVALILGCGGGSPPPGARRSGSSQGVEHADASLTARARLLAGLLPDEADRFDSVTSLGAWRNWQKEFDLEWREATANRFAPMSRWSREHLAPVASPCETLLYPFSGPDILNAVVLFPDCRRYVLFGLEHTGVLPAIERLPAERVGRLIDETRHALGDLLTRNYAITRHMMQELAATELHGNFPLLAVFLARLDGRIVAARDLEIGEDGRLHAAGHAPASSSHKVAPALEIVFERPNRPAQTLLYFRAQAEDTAIRQRPGVVPFLDAQGSCVTFLKSASYLMHGTQFRIVRDLLLRQSSAILQDDSGIPLRFLRPPDWTVALFGRYDRPVKDFNYGYQPDLAEAYAHEGVEPLTFSFGYHWEAGSSTVMLAVRRARPASGRR
jgi:hypothetical protein